MLTHPAGLLSTSPGRLPTSANEQPTAELELRPVETRLLEARVELNAGINLQPVGFHLIAKIAPCFLDQVGVENPLPVCRIDVTEAECWYLARIVQSDDEVYEGGQTQNIGIPLLRKIYRNLLELRALGQNAEGISGLFPLAENYDDKSYRDTYKDTDEDPYSPA